MDPIVKLAKQTIVKYLSKKELPDESKLPQELLNKKAGCFVSLHQKQDDQLRGCIGTISPTCKNLAGEIMMNAIQTATSDPRFPAVKINELKDLKVSVDILSKPEFIHSQNLLDPKKYGVIVKTNDGRTGLLLPDIEGVDDPLHQIAIARQKAGILPDEEIYIYRFTVQRYKE